MPTSRHAGLNENNASQSQGNICFPDNHHLLITTSRHVFAWNSTGIQRIFKSRSEGIVAARAAKDGSGILAVAGQNVVVLHDLNRDEESWGLNDAVDEVRCLEYSPDSKSLFWSTTSEGTIYQFDTQTSRLLGSPQKHEAPPVAMAISATGQMILSASHNPPVVYLKNMSHNTPPLHIQPNASHAPVSSVAFHPERPNIFLLAFRDGTIAAYDANKMPRGQRGAFANQQSVNNSEISRIPAVHRAVLPDRSLGKSLDPAPIAGVGYLPGFKTRAVTAGRDGKCKLVDFSNGGEVLRTWHAKAPLTSLAILNVKDERREYVHHRVDSEGQRGRNRSSGSHTLGGPTSINNVIAVSRVDGEVHLYDSLGLLLAKNVVGSQEERILSLEWVKGLALQAHDRIGGGNSLLDSIAPLDPKLASPETMKQRHGDPPQHQQIRRPRDATVEESDFRKDELGDCTIRYTPSTHETPAVPPVVAQYLDLFSPVKPDEVAKEDTSKPRMASPHKNRPRISSRTFVKSSQPTTKSNHENQLEAMSFTSKVTADVSSAGRWRQHTPPKSVKRINTSTFALARKQGLASLPLFAGRPRYNNGGDVAQSREHAKVLAGLRRIAGPKAPQNIHGTLSSVTSSQRLRSGINKHRSPAKSVKDVAQKNPTEGVLRREVHISDPSTWPTDSVSATSLSDDDIWLTSSSEDNSSQPRKWRTRPPIRPPAHQNSVTNARLNPDHPSADPSHICPDGSFSPTSDGVRALFPRSTSLSPRRNVEPPARPPLRESKAASNAAPGPRPRARKSSTAKAVVVFEDPPSAPVDGDGRSCATCPATEGRVQSLEGEVARLKGEVLMLKAVLRRNGLVCPASLR